MKLQHTTLSIIIFSFFIYSNNIFAYSGEIIPIKLSINPIPVSKIISSKIGESRDGIVQKIQNTPSDDYILVKTGTSIEVYENSIDKIYVQRINVSSGLTITPFFEFHSYDESTGEPLYTQFKVKEKINTLSEKPFSFINGQFFNPKRQHTPLSFGLKTKNLILTAGAEDRDRKKNIFSLGSSGAKIISYSWENFRDEQADFAIVNLSMESYESKENFVGRTYICILKPDDNGYSQTILTFSFIAATEEYARYVLHSWGCRDEYTSKLDSSGSSQFGLGEDIYYGYTKKGSPDYRKLPNIIGFYEK